MKNLNEIIGALSDERQAKIAARVEQLTGGSMKLVIVESPYAARKWPRWFHRWQNKRYARKCLRDCLRRREAPLASHLLYTQPGVLRDSVAEERMKGINAGHAWMAKADLCVVYSDRGISTGMVYGIQKARKLGIPVEQRWLKSPP